MAKDRRSTVVKVVAAGVVTAFVALTVGTVLPSGPSEPSATTTTVRLGREGQELLELLDKRDGATYHARYQASASDVSALVIETWQAPPRVRQDSEVRSEGQVVRARVLVTPQGRVRCAQLNDAAWTCRPATGADETLDPLASFRRRLGQGEVTARDASIEGRSSRCFELRTADGTSELCVLPDTGIPVRVRGGQTQLRLMLLDEKVTPDLFEPPAPVARS